MAAYVPAELISGSAIHQIERVAGWFPAAITNSFCFELELKEESNSSDFSFICRRNEIGVEILAGSSEIELPEPLFTNPIWQNIRTFCSALSESDSKFKDSIPYLWLEFDIRDQQQIPSPLIFLGIPHHCCEEVAWLIPVLEMLGDSITDPFLEILKKSFRFAASSTKGFEIALMLSRNTDMARLVFHGVDDTILSLLTDLGYGETSHLKRIMADLAELKAHITVDIDAGKTIGPKIGLECQFSGNVRMDQPLWEKAFDYVVSHGYCTPAKREAILRWPGGSREKLKHLLAPVQAIRKINHYKINWQADVPVQAKAYLLARYF
jgi:hypothetical protein